MSANTTIEWATKSWNPVRGCSRVSPGCDECYAMKFAHRFSGPGKPYEGLTTIRKGKVDWSGVARFIPGEIDAPLRWKKPERVFVNSMSDLFHHSLSFEEIAAVFGVMAAAPRHQFLVLTKRPERAVEFFAWLGSGGSPAPWIRANWSKIRGLFANGAGANVLNAAGVWAECPLPNVWFGISAENQDLFEERWEHARKVPAAVRFVSYEPALGPLRLPGTVSDELHWGIVGGESGPGARAMDVAWVSFFVSACQRRGVAPFVKQLGSYPQATCPECGRSVGRHVRGGFVDSCGAQHDALIEQIKRVRNSKGGDPSEWPEDLRIRSFPRSP
jgi:protein gp37